MEQHLETPAFMPGSLICSASGGLQPAFVLGVRQHRSALTRHATHHHLHAVRRDGRGGLKATASRANEAPRPKGRGFITIDPRPRAHRAYSYSAQSDEVNSDARSSFGSG